MINNAKALEMRSWPRNEDGWYVSPNGNRVILGDGIMLGDWVKLGEGVTLGDRVILGDGVKLGDWVTLGNRVTLGDRVILGNEVILGNGVKLGDRVTLGNGVTLSEGVKLGNRVILGDWVTLGGGITSDQLNQQFRQAYIDAGPEHIFTKWVTKGRLSPGWAGLSPIRYNMGAVVECLEAVISDQQCDVGLHVFRFGYRPEWNGLCSVEHDYIPIRVSVRSEDICFAGMPGNDAKLRVKRLKVLD